MSKVSLKEYLRDINSLIEQNHIREAKEHCAFILKSYPKYIDVYRLLGKAHLESRRYDEAEKIFVRLLAVLPDDFISHLGMSVVKEEQENLDAAIWHMERAYELKSTQTIHEELHRLFTLRDGIAPPKPLITRGALIRINVRSGLYQQALKEIEHALKEDPQRLDLEILRAQIYFQQKNIPLAVRSCKMILQKRPYAYDANLLMTEIASTPEQAEPFKQRMFELDPYTSLVDDDTSLEEVPAEAIMIEKLDIPMQASRNGAKITDELDALSQDIGKETSPSDNQPLIEKIAPAISVEENKPVGNLEDSTLLEANAHENAHIPDFMQEAGWSAGEHRTEEEEQALIAEYDQIAPTNTITDENTTIAETDIPDWLRDLAPIREEPLYSPVEEEKEEEKIAWLSDILPEHNAEASIQQDQSNANIAPPNFKDIRKSPFSNAPEFGQDLDADQEWLEMVSSPDPHLPDPDNQSLDRPSRMPKPEEVMDFSYEESDELENEKPPSTMGEGEDEDIDSAIAWLEGLAAKQGAEEEVLFSDLDARQQKPDWLNQEFEDDYEDEGPSFLVAEDDEPKDEFFEDDSEQFDFINDTNSTLVAEDIPLGSSPESIQDTPDWDDAEVPEWLKTIAPPEFVEGQETAADHKDEVDHDELFIPEHLDSLFGDGAEEQFTETEESLSIEYPEEENDEETIFSEFSDYEDKIQEEPPAPKSEQFATTAVLDFIKKEVEDDIDEVDNWLKSLPQSPQDETSFESGNQESLDNYQEEIFSDKFDEGAVETANDVEFIDHYFADEIENAAIDEPEYESDDQEPYTWEQEYEPVAVDQTDLPDWIAGIEDDDIRPADEPSTKELVTLEEELSEENSISETGDMPGWMTTLIDDSKTQTSPDEFKKIDTKDLFDEPEIEVPEIYEEPAETLEVIEAALHQVPPEPQVNFEDQDLEEVFLIAKNKLHNGEFDDAFPRMRELLEKDEWQEQVIAALVFDIDNYHPIEVESWVLLGDTYNKQGRLREALAAYTKAEEFIK